MLKKYLAIWIALISVHASAQQLIKAKLVNAKKQPVVFASIGYLHHHEGASTDSSGNFQVNFIKDDSIKISAIGYLTKTILFTAAVDTVITLEENFNQLSDVTVIGVRQNKHNYLGHFEHRNNFTMMLSTELQTATFIPNENVERGFISELHFKLNKTAGNKYFLRIRLYKMDTLTGLPGKELALSDTTVSPKNLRRNNKIDLSKKNIRLPSKGVFVSLEWLADKDFQRNKQPPEMYGNAEATSNFTYYNFKEVQWYAADAKSRISGTYDVLNLELKINY